MTSHPPSHAASRRRRASRPGRSAWSRASSSGSRRPRRPTAWPRRSASSSLLRRPAVAGHRDPGLRPDAVHRDRLPGAEQGRPGLRHDVHLGDPGVRARRPAGWAAGASSPPTSWSWRAWPRSPASTCSCSSTPTASGTIRPAAGCCSSASSGSSLMTYICYVGVELSARLQQVLLALELIVLLVFAVVALVKVGSGQRRRRSIDVVLVLVQPVRHRRTSRRSSAACC